MEEINSKKTEAFLSAIKELAAEECKQIDEETDRLRVERLKSLQSEARKRYKSYMEYEIARIRADSNTAISNYEEKSRKTLTDLRNSLCEKVFALAGEKINEYTKTPAYKAMLINSAKEIAEEFNGGEVELFVREEDMQFAEDIKSAFSGNCKVSASKDIVFGGIKAADSKSNCMADDTLDSKLEQKKEWFLENSGLSIEE